MARQQRLVPGNLRRAERKRDRDIVGKLRGQLGKIDALAVDPRRRSRLEQHHLKTEIFEVIRQPGRIRFPHPSRRGDLTAHMNTAAQKGPGGHDHGPTGKGQPAFGLQPGHTAVGHNHFGGFVFDHAQVRLTEDNPLNIFFVTLAVGLATRRAHGLPLGGVQLTELDAGAVRGQTHFAAQRVDLLHQLTLADTADGGIAAHLTDRMLGKGHHQGRSPHPAGRQGRFHAGVSAPDHNDIKMLRHSLKTG